MVLARFQTLIGPTSPGAFVTLMLISSPGPHVTLMLTSLGPHVTLVRQALLAPRASRLFILTVPDFVDRTHHVTLVFTSLGPM